MTLFPLSFNFWCLPSSGNYCTRAGLQFLWNIVGVAFGLLISESVAAQKQIAPLFSDQARVCFVGNSITQSGGYHHYIYLYHVTRFPKERVRFFNCGVGGDVASKILARMDEDILIHDPDHLVLMVGMNDVGRSLYSTANAHKPSVDEKKQAALKTYVKDTEKIVRRFREHTASIILLKPSIYDQTSMMETENMMGANDALREYGDHLSDLAQDYGTQIVDFWTIMNDLNLQEQQKDPRYTIIGPDRIHPRVTGHMVMAYTFLRTLGAPQYVSHMVVHKRKEQSNRASLNCEINSVCFSNERISFSVLERSLPFPKPAGADEAFSLVPFIDELNREVLEVPDLPDGDYDLRIDGVLIGTFSAHHLRTGVNLALYEQTPQYQQALKVQELCVEIRRLQGKLRLLRRVEYVELTESQRVLSMDSLKAILGDRLTSKYLHDRYEFNKKLFTDYLIIKPRAEAIRDSIRMQEDRLYQINLPTEHTFEIVNNS